MRLFSRECGFDDTNAVRVEFALRQLAPSVLGARPPLASQSRRPGVPQQRTGTELAPSGSNSANVPQNAGINSAPAHDGIFRDFISSLNPDDPSVTWITLAL